MFQHTDTETHGLAFIAIYTRNFYTYIRCKTIATNNRRKIVFLFFAFRFFFKVNCIKLSVIL